MTADLKAIETQVRHWTFEVSIIGRTNAGKSTLLNALLRKQVLPSSVQAQTGPWLHIRHDESPREPTLSLDRELTPQEEKLVKQAFKIEEITVTGCSKITHQLQQLNENFRNWKQIPDVFNSEKLVLRCPIPCFQGLSSNTTFEFVDTAGFH
ncbi:hypothetical protein Pelo_9679 [Pelomyxa schiedti]|nr:hypothetical protein Pelo_9679 [Pelomyxa schiedti]